MIACQTDRPSVVDAIIKKGANMNLFNKEGNTALCQATQSGNESCVKLLVKANVDLNAVGEFGNTALDLAISTKFKGCGEYLRSAGAECIKLKYPGTWNQYD